jgi:hypothetical protein
MKTKTPQSNVGIMKNTTKQCRNECDFVFIPTLFCGVFIIPTLLCGVFVLIPRLCKQKTPQNNVRIKKNTTQCRNKSENTTKQCKSYEKHHKTM